MSLFYHPILTLSSPYSQARCDNMADVSAKDGSQETLVNLAALITNLTLLPYLTSTLKYVNHPAVIYCFINYFDALYTFINYHVV